METKESVSILKKYEELAAACNRCGFCTSYCPTYKTTGNEALSPRGRNQLFRALLEGKVQNSAAAKSSIDTCLLCGECTSVCFSEVPTAQLMMTARHYLNKEGGAPWGIKFFIEKILCFPQRLKWVLKFFFFLKKLGLPFLLRKSGLLGRYFPSAEAADALMDHVSLKFLLEYSSANKRFVPKGDPTRQSPSLPPFQRTRVAYMPVCGSQYLLPDIGLATLKLFDLLKVDVVIPEALCCGLPASSSGFTSQALHMAKENVGRFEKGHYESIVVDDTSCAAQLKEWPTLFQNDLEWLKRAQDISQRVRGLSSFFIEKGLTNHLKLAGWTGGPVAYHDPCKAQYGLKSTQPPRDLLSAIPRLMIVPIHDSDQCCGGGGSFSVTHPKLSRSILDEKIKNIVESGCKIVVTSSVSCLIQLSSGLRKQGSSIEALHITEFLTRVLEKRRM
ncbi:MAG: Lactate utilization protein A [Elusimicrobia bacterium]|nr:Lactate utilization protein A [Elusimicrobiota bacterium]